MSQGLVKKKKWFPGLATTCTSGQDTDSQTLVTKRPQRRLNSFSAGSEARRLCDANVATEVERFVCVAVIMMHMSSIIVAACRIFIHRVPASKAVLDDHFQYLYINVFYFILLQRYTINFPSHFWFHYTSIISTFH